MSMFKRALFWLTFVPIGIVFLVLLVVLEVCGKWGDAVDDVVDVTLRKWEHWCFDIPKGTFYNCPWRDPISKVWNDALARAAEQPYQ